MKYIKNNIKVGPIVNTWKVARTEKLLFFFVFIDGKPIFQIPGTVRIVGYFQNLTNTSALIYFQSINLLLHQEIYTFFISEYIMETYISILQIPGFSGLPISIRSTSTCTNPEHIRAKNIKRRNRRSTIPIPFISFLELKQRQTRRTKTPMIHKVWLRVKNTHGVSILKLRTLVDSQKFQLMYVYLKHIS